MSNSGLNACNVFLLKGSSLYVEVMIPIMMYNLQVKALPNTFYIFNIMRLLNEQFSEGKITSSYEGHEKSLHFTL